MDKQLQKQIEKQVQQMCTFVAEDLISRKIHPMALIIMQGKIAFFREHLN